MKLKITTPSQIDLREVITLGCTTKGDGTKIGHKGSGLKFSLALFHRLGSSLSILVPGLHYRSEVRKDTIRDQEHEFIVLREHNGGAEIPASITTGAGKDTWTEPWAGIRELAQNAKDEDGTIEAVEGDAPEVSPESGTVMFLPLTPLLEEAWEQRETWMHPRHPEICYNASPAGLFYHGFRIYTCADWKWSYDVTGILDRSNLSEDRQLRNQDMNSLFKGILTKCADLPQSFYDLVAAGTGKDCTEFSQDVRYLLEAIYYATNSSDQEQAGGFRMSKLVQAFKSRYGENLCYSESSASQVMHYYAEAAGYFPVRVHYRVSRILQYSSIKNASECLPEVSERVKSVMATEMPAEAKDKLKMAIKITKRLRPDDTAVRVVRPGHEQDEEMKASAMAIQKDGRKEVLILESHVKNSDVTTLVATLAHEYAHIESGAGDFSQAFEHTLCNTIAKLLMPKKRMAGALEF